MRTALKHLCFAMGLGIVLIGAIGLVVPSTLVWIGREAESSRAMVFIAAVRVAFGLALITAAPASRTPRALWLLGCVVLVAGVSTAITGLFAAERARGLIDAWIAQGDSSVRFTGMLLLALGGFVAFACSPLRQRWIHESIG